MKNILGIILLSLIMMLAACASDQNNSDPDPLDPQNRKPEMESNTNSPSRDQLGFVRYTQDEFDQNNEPDPKAIHMDRNEIADMITRILLQNPDFKEVATLVTDEEALIAFEASNNISKQTAIENAEKTALSILPGYYTIHASDDNSLIQNIETLHYSVMEDENLDMEPLVQTIVDSMKKDD
ncbi:YhcN/YlaJ family sporulation lipoprotein [Oceanobacillus sp. CFH 90083]|uniref:YhcN/YlaJ family sporulation lipoprotein n=1 Tax=Oceanobacillus sp. CFH 90083 TaxID=2592336 RepID=UPI00128E6D26|nr:YhcN/YlaJ family sporulation lipoprotein [Oceanobacillus sp. CFH 90083]